MLNIKAILSYFNQFSDRQSAQKYFKLKKEIAKIERFNQSKKILDDLEKKKKELS